jgi:hypothetical protein
MAGEVCWPLDPACLTTEWDAFSPEVKDRAHLLAVQTLRHLTAYRVGGCPITVRPCKPECCPLGYSNFSWAGQPFYPQNWGGLWTNCGCQGSCTCKAACEIKLPAPIGDLVEVKADGVVVPLTDFRVDNSNTLVYQGSDDCPFNMAQDLSLPDTEVGTWSITYVNSHLPDATAEYAAGILAVEFGQACTGGKCALPKNVVSMVRNGVSYEIAPGMFPDGFTGIKTVDAFIGQWKPLGSPQWQMRVYSPDVPQLRHTTRTC